MRFFKESLRALLLKIKHPTWMQQFEALTAYRGLTLQAYLHKPFSPLVHPLVWGKDDFYLESNLPPGSMPASRERSYSAHFYGHDIVIKRFAGMPLVGAYIPFTIEHGLKLSASSYFEKPCKFTKGFLCMSQERSKRLDELFSSRSVAIGPWIHYAKPVLDKDTLYQLKSELGKTLLVIGSHNWGNVTRQYDHQSFVRRVDAIKEIYAYQSVICSKHWMDNPNNYPQDWIFACHGHKLNPWFLDSLKTLLALSDGLASNSVGTHLGYAIYESKDVHWVPVDVQQDVSSLSGELLKSEEAEWEARINFRSILNSVSKNGEEPLSIDNSNVYTEFNSHWGFSSVKTPEELKTILSS